MARSKATLKVFRFDPDKDRSHRFDRFEVPVAPGLTVLGALLYVQEHLDGSVAFRSSCRAGVCGSCAMNIDGHYGLACETQVAALGSTITLRPLGHLPVIKDLFLDMKPFWDKYRAIKPYLIPGSTPEKGERLQSPDERAKLDQIIDCILCASCHASCPLTAMDEAYLGPAALLWADRFIRDSRDDAAWERVELVAHEHGIFRCHTIFNCKEVCPKDCNPTGAIADLKLKAMELKGGLKR